MATINLRSKEEAVALTATLQNTAESTENRLAACDAVLACTKSDAACAILCSAGGIHGIAPESRVAHRTAISLTKSAHSCAPSGLYDPVGRLRSLLGACLRLSACQLSVELLMLCFLWLLKT